MQMTKEDVLLDQQQYHFLFMLTAREAEVSHGPDASLTLRDTDPKALYMTARPGRDRAFISTDRFMKTWMKNTPAFALNAPRVSFLHSQMKIDADNVSQAVSINIFDPGEAGGGWQFKLGTKGNDLPGGRYEGIILFIDWAPATGSPPEPIRLELPSLFGDVLRRDRET
ncbi:MAG: hypothetical protein JO108_07620 [Acidobacteriaceae bacterium]|nr:hypothetical protein [Acidobacteriaceae bacterium]